MEVMTEEYGLVDIRELLSMYRKEAEEMRVQTQQVPLIAAKNAQIAELERRIKEIANGGSSG